jgi:hypothetical protein
MPLRPFGPPPPEEIKTIYFYVNTSYMFSEPRYVTFILLIK